MKNNINTYITLNKSEIRNLYQKKRLSLDEDYIEKHSKVICDNLLKTLVQKFKNLDNLKIALYFPANNEVDTKYFAEEISKEHKNIKILMPKIQGDILEFNEYTNESKIEYNTTYKSIIEIDSNTYYIPDIIV
jgi:5-formyltetrahydrofolate cyclo-ligase